MHTWKHFTEKVDPSLHEYLDIWRGFPSRVRKKFLLLLICPWRVKKRDVFACFISRVGSEERMMTTSVQIPVWWDWWRSFHKRRSTVYVAGVCISQQSLWDSPVKTWMIYQSRLSEDENTLHMSMSTVSVHYTFISDRVYGDFPCIFP